MTSLGEMAADAARKFFSALVPDDALCMESPRRNPNMDSPRRPFPGDPSCEERQTVAAPCSAYHPGRPSFGACDALGEGCPGSFCDPQACEDAAFQGAQSMVAMRNATFPMLQPQQSVLIPFKDGSSQIMKRDRYESFQRISQTASHYNRQPPTPKSSRPQARPQPQPVPESAPMNAPEKHESVFIPFKDGSSQIYTGRMSALDSQMNLKGASFLVSDAYKSRENQFFISDPEDIVDVKVAEYFQAKPDVYLVTRFTRVRQGVYSMRGREVEVEFVQEQLVVKEGLGKQPFAEYLEATERPVLQPTPDFQANVFKANNNLNAIPKNYRLTFNDTDFGYSRMDAMKVAKEQAMLREQAAEMMKTKGQVPKMDRLMSRYEKTMDMKLGAKGRERRFTEVSIPAHPRAISHAD